MKFAKRLIPGETSTTQCNTIQRLRSQIMKIDTPIENLNTNAKYYITFIHILEMNHPFEPVISV